MHRLSFRWNQLDQLAAFIAGLEQQRLLYAVAHDNVGIEVMWDGRFR